MNKFGKSFIIENKEDNLLAKAAIGDLDALKQFIELEVTYKKERLQQTIALAASNNHLNIISYLIENGYADMGKYLKSTVFWVVSRDNIEILRYLVSQGVDLFAEKLRTELLGYLKYHVCDTKSFKCFKYLCELYYEKYGIECCLTSDVEALRKYAKEFV